MNCGRSFYQQSYEIRDIVNEVVSKKEKLPDVNSLMRGRSFTNNLNSLPDKLNETVFENECLPALNVVN